jgi:hypothetical protein
VKYEKRIITSLIVILSLVWIIGSALFINATTASSLNNIFVISSGIYPGGTAYTVYSGPDGTWYAKNGYGTNDFSSSDAATTINEAIKLAPYAGEVKVIGTALLTDTIVINKNISFTFETIILPSGMLKNGINVTNVFGDVGHFSVTGNQLAVYDTAWNADALLVRKCSNLYIDIGYIVNYNARKGVGYHLYAGQGEGCSTNMFSGRVGYFDTNILFSTDGTGWINQNTIQDANCDGAGTYNVRLYNNGNGIGANNFINFYTEPTSNGGYNIHLSTGPDAVYHTINYNQFTNYDAFDVISHPTSTDYYADDSVIFTKFSGGFIVSGQWQDYGKMTVLTGVFDQSTNTIVNTPNTDGVSISTSGWTEFYVNGSGQILDTATYLGAVTGNTAQSNAAGYVNAYMLAPSSTTYSQMSFQTCPYTFTFSLERHDDMAASDEITRFQIKNPAEIDELTSVGLGVYTIGNVLYGESYGTTRGQVELTTVASAKMYNIKIVVTPNERVDFFVNGILEGSITTASQLPVALGSPRLWISAQNGANSQWVSLGISNINILYPSVW